MANGRRGVAAAAQSQPSVARTYEGSVGPFPVNAEPTLMLRDPARKKNLRVRVTYPAGPGPFPLIVWSHGFGASKDNYGPLVKYWAAHGYVVVQPNHTDARTEQGPGLGFGDWRNRPRDLSFVVDSLGEIGRRVGGLDGKTDASRIGVGGHSYGAHTAMLIAGMTVFAGSAPVSFADRRVSAAIVLSGQGRGEGRTEKSWSGVTEPMLVITGTRDPAPRTGNGYTWRLEPYTYAPPGDKYLVVIKGAHHGFGGVVGRAYTGPGSGPPNSQQVAYVRAVTLAFWDAYLRGDESARAYLQSERLEADSGGDVEIQHK